MTSIIGNQEQRKSKIDTEKWKEHREYYSNPENIKKISEKEATTNNLERIVLKHDSNGTLGFNTLGIPKIKITPMKNVNVHTTRQLQYDTLMILYDCAGWKWVNNEIPTEQNNWPEYKSKTVIAAYKNSKGTGQIFKYDSSDRTIGTKYYNISFKEFCMRQGITEGIINTVGMWYDLNKPDRASRGK